MSWVVSARIQGQTHLTNHVSRTDLSGTAGIQATEPEAHELEFDVVLSGRQRFDEKPGNPVQALIRFRQRQSLTSVGEWTSLYDGNARRFASDSNRNYLFDAGKISLSLVTSGFRGSPEVFEGHLELEGRTAPIHLFCFHEKQSELGATHPPASIK